MTFKDAITAPTKTICRDITASERLGSQCNAILRRDAISEFGPYRTCHVALTMSVQLAKRISRSRASTSGNDPKPTSPRTRRCALAQAIAG